MIGKKIAVSVLMGGLLVFAIPAASYALIASPQALPGASNASDYQPTTGNPQNNVGSVQQGQSSQSDIQKPGSVDQTALPAVNDLRVPGVTSEPNENTTKTEIETTEKQAISTWLLIVLGGLVVAGVVYVIASTSSKRNKQATSSDSQLKGSVSASTAKSETTAEVDQPTDTAEAAEVNQPAKKAKSPAKKNSKRKKSSKKSKRKR